MEEVSKELSVEYKIYSPPYRPQSNGRIESFHYFLKACIAKHIAPQLEWDDIVPLACAAYNFLPQENGTSNGEQDTESSRLSTKDATCTSKTKLQEKSDPAMLRTLALNQSVNYGM